MADKTVLRRAMFVAALLAVLYLLSGIPSAARPFNADDLRHDWAAGKALLRGEDFYDGTTLRAIWAERPEPGAVPGTPAYPFLNAPHAAIFAAPFSALPFSQAKIVFAIVSLLGYAAAVIVLLRTVARRWSRQAQVAGAAAAAGFAPVWFAVASGQVSLLVFAALVAGFAALLARRDAPAGALFAVGAFKFTMGFLVFPYLAYRRRWRALAVSIGLAGGLSVVALAVSGFGSIESYIRSARAAQSGINSPFGPASGSDLSLLPLAARIVNQHRAAAYLVFGLALAGIIAALWRVLRTRDEPSWIELSLVLLACQLAVYHRAYDAVVVLLAGAVALSEERIRRAPLALAIALGSVFVVANAHSPLARGSWLWEVVVLSHRTWATLTLFGILCWSAVDRRAQSNGFASNP